MQHITATAPHPETGDTVTFEFHTARTEKDEITVVAWKGMKLYEKVEVDIEKIEFTARPATIGDVA